MVDFGSEQGLSNFETAGIAGYFEDFKRAKTPLRAKRCRLWMGTNYWSRMINGPDPYQNAEQRKIGRLWMDTI